MLVNASLIGLLIPPSDRVSWWISDQRSHQESHTNLMATIQICVFHIFFQPLNFVFQIITQALEPYLSNICKHLKIASVIGIAEA